MSNLAFIGILMRTRSLGLKYEERMFMMTKYAAALEALNDFEHGTLRLYKLMECGERECANRNEGPFEIWYMPYYSILGKPAVEAQEVFVSMYNEKMKRMYEKKEGDK
jgi:hypothetical protein